MASTEEFERRRTQIIKEQEIFKAAAVTTFGPVLGMDYADYAQDKIGEQDPLDVRRTRFIETVVNLLEEGPREQKVLALGALLEAVEDRFSQRIREATRPMVF
jgi:hypothetical protein